jgi:hypothetical protein
VKSLAYRSPQLEMRLDRIRALLRNRQAGFWLRILTKLSLGIPLSFVGPALFAFILTAMLLRLRVQNPPAWLTLFWISCLIILPILYYSEWRTSGSFFMYEMRAQGVSSSDAYSASSSGEFEFRQATAVGAAYTEILLFAPKQVFSAISDLRQRIKLTDDEMQRAAEIVHQLSTTDGSLAIAELGRANDSRTSLQRVLRYLHFHDWIDLSKRADRAWLLSTARKWLTR